MMVEYIHKFGHEKMLSTIKNNCMVRRFDKTDYMCPTYRDTIYNLGVAIDLDCAVLWSVVSDKDSGISDAVFIKNGNYEFRWTRPNSITNSTWIIDILDMEKNLKKIYTLGDKISIGIGVATVVLGWGVAYYVNRSNINNLYKLVAKL